MPIPIENNWKYLFRLSPVYNLLIITQLRPVWCTIENYDAYYRGNLGEIFQSYTSQLVLPVTQIRNTLPGNMLRPTQSGFSLYHEYRAMVCKLCLCRDWLFVFFAPDFGLKMKLLVPIFALWYNLIANEYHNSRSSDTRAISRQRFIHWCNEQNHLQQGIYASYMIIPDRAIRNALVAKHLYTGPTGKIIWDGYICWPNGKLNWNMPNQTVSQLFDVCIIFVGIL